MGIAIGVVIVGVVWTEIVLLPVWEAAICSSGISPCIVLLIYRPGSRAADASFFTELSDLLDRLVTFVDPIMVVGDLNIRLDRPDDPHSRRLLSYWRRTTCRAACHRRHTTMVASSTLC